MTIRGLCITIAVSTLIAFVMIGIDEKNRKEESSPDNAVNTVTCTIEDVSTITEDFLTERHYVLLKNDAGVTTQFSVTNDVYAAMVYKKGDTITIYSTEGISWLHKGTYHWYWEGNELRNPTKDNKAIQCLSVAAIVCYCGFFLISILRR